MSEENDDNSIDIEKDGNTENEGVVVQDKSSSDEVKNGAISNASRFVSQREIISIIFSKKTLYHVIVLFSLLLFFGIISYTKSDLASSLIFFLSFLYAWYCFNPKGSFVISPDSLITFAFSTTDLK